jgi:dienelactone hydrolase
VDSLSERWAALKPHIQVHGPPGRRPTAILFHGCGGLGTHLDGYAAAAVAAGARAVVVDSYAPRGWPPAFGKAFVCTGMAFRGAERAGDVLAAAHGAMAELDAESLILAGWSHGGWSIMDLMTMPLQREGEAGLADPTPEPLARVKGLFLAYAYGGLGNLSRHRPWVRAPRTLAVLGEKDMVTSPRDAARLYDAIATGGCPIEVWRLPGAHAYDEDDTDLSFYRYDPDLAAQTVARFGAFVGEALGGA